MSLESKLKQQEGFNLHLYYDTEGAPTIGWGTNVSKIDEEEAEFLFNHRLALVEEELFSKFPWIRNFDRARRDVFVNMAYNMGVPRLSQFKKMLGHSRLGEWREAAIEGLDSKWATQVGYRAKTLMRQLESGEEIE